jgi:ribosomal protein L37AE/L43A
MTDPKPEVVLEHDFPLLKIGGLYSLMKAAQEFLMAPSPRQIAEWSVWRASWVTSLNIWPRLLEGFRPYRYVDTDNPFTWRRIEMPWRIVDYRAHRATAKAVDDLLERLLTATPPAPLAVALDLDPTDPRDSDGWTDAVARQGIVPPRGDDYYRSTHWTLLNEELKQHQCAECATTTRRTRLHHENPESFGRERPSDLTELCDRCHVRRHGAGIWKKAA